MAEEVQLKETSKHRDGYYFIGNKIYQIDRTKLLGSGGQANVYLGYEVDAEGNKLKEVAIKEYGSIDFDDEPIFENFEEMSHMIQMELILMLEAASLNPSLFVTALDIFIDKTRKFFGTNILIMEMLSPESWPDLQDVMEKENLTIGTVLHIFDQMAQALDGLAKKGIIHQDFKRSNIKVNVATWDAKLSDFGTADFTPDRLQKTGLDRNVKIAGTYPYMAPEKFEGKVSIQSEVYSMAMVLYECLTGERYYKSDNPLGYLALHKFGVEIPRPENLGMEKSKQEVLANVFLDESLPDNLKLQNAQIVKDLLQVFDKALKRDPRQRYPDCTTFIKAVTKALRLPAWKPPVVTP